MTRWVAFAALTLLVVTVVLFSARASERVVDEMAAERTSHTDSILHAETLPDGADHLDAARPIETRTPAEPSLSSMALLVNVGASHALFAVVLLAGLWLANVPVSTLGIGVEPFTGAVAVVAGIVVGLALAFANTLVGSLVESDPSAKLRQLLAPDSIGGWAVLLLVVLPIIAGFEELLFRSILIGTFSSGFGISPWILAVGSSMLFAAGHGAQGRIGIVATGVLGFVLAAVFVVTNSFLVVFFAHYVVNVVEFVVVEGFEYEPFRR